MRRRGNRHGERKREGWGHGGMSGHMPVVKKPREMGTYRGMLEG